jgi:nitrite reductase/ring-hydroxylating ferredoxin subunit
MKLHDICALSDIPDQQARGFRIGQAGHELQFLIVRRGEHIFGYLNHCPHTGVNLNWFPGQFFDSSGQLIQCSTHGAQFRIQDGYRTWGPCSGRSLTAVRLKLENDRIKIQV